MNSNLTIDYKPRFPYYSELPLNHPQNEPFVSSLAVWALERINGSAKPYHKKHLGVIDNGANFLTKTYKFKQPVNLSKFDIELVNQFGKTVDMNYIDFSMTLEVGQIYDSGDYDKYNFNLRNR